MNTIREIRIILQSRSIRYDNLHFTVDLHEYLRARKKRKKNGRKKKNPKMSKSSPEDLEDQLLREIGFLFSYS